MPVVAVPGFADTPAYWADAIACALGQKETHAVEWPGLWGAASSETPVQDMIDATAAAATLETLLVGHSLGARIVLAASARVRPLGLVLLAPALAVPQFATGERLERWLADGFRRTCRPEPEGTAQRCWDVGVEFAHGVLDLPRPAVPTVPCLVVAMSEDTRQNETTVELLAGLPTVRIVRVDGPHRFWEERESLVAITDAVAAWAWR